MPKANKRQAKKRTLPAQLEKHKFPPGVSGNPGGRPKRKPFTEMLQTLLTKQPKLLAAIVTAQLKKAKKGDTRAFKEVRDTLQGKPMQEIELAGELTVPEELASVGDIDARIKRLFDRALARAAKTSGKT